MDPITIVFRLPVQFSPVLFIAEPSTSGGTPTPMVERAFRTPEVDRGTLAPLNRVFQSPAVDRESLAVLDR